MEKKLDVYLHRNKVGYLILDKNGQMAFDYDLQWLNNPNATPLSYSLPLQDQPFKHKTCRGFFAGILPEENKRAIIARNLGISKQNDFAMLEQIGGECAGAITFIPHGKFLPDDNYQYRPLTESELLKVLNILPYQPLLAGEEGIRLSLAGAQDKIAVHVLNKIISLPLGGAPSTHILKPAIEQFKGLVFNEAFCLKLASAIGLPTVEVSIGSIQEIKYLLVERYDRTKDKNNIVHRLHQEDFCQALGIPPERKYQNEGGPSLKACFTLLRKISDIPAIDLQHLLNAVIFNWLIGNHDAHGKNFSLLYDNQGHARLVPLYDLISTIYYPNLSKKMAMKIGKEYQSNKIFPRHFERLAQDAELSISMIEKQVIKLAETVINSLPKINIEQTITERLMNIIKSRCEKVLVRFRKLV